MNDFVGVKIALLIENQLVMILRDNKPGLRFAGMWDFPGGGREGDESPEECIKRELKEELALELPKDSLVWENETEAMHDSNLKAYFLVAKLTSNDIKIFT
jgi:8-oxo-dGTP diphosphatase